MTRQQAITLAQIESKLQDARRRMNDACADCIKAETHEAYRKHLDAAMHAGRDYITWSEVRKSLI
jgi:hypothetical protein